MRIYCIGSDISWVNSHVSWAIHYLNTVAIQLYSIEKKKCVVNEKKMENLLSHKDHLRQLVKKKGKK